MLQPEGTGQVSKDGDPKRRIAALEMLGPPLNLGSKKPYTAAILMELVLLLHGHGCSLAVNHVPREFNE